MRATEVMAKSEPVEAVIISGPKRGKIVRLGSQQVQDEATQEEINALNDALDRLIAKLDKVSAGIRAAIVAIKTPTPEKS